MEAACQRLRAIRPDVVCRGVDLEIPMPGSRCRDTLAPRKKEGEARRLSAGVIEFLFQGSSSRLAGSKEDACDCQTAETP